MWCNLFIIRYRSVITGAGKNVTRPFTAVAANKAPTPTTPTTQKTRKLAVDSTYHDFKCVDTKFYPNFNMTAYMLEHERLGSKYLHIDRNESNNVFSINFRTPIYDSSGLPHILEHLALCGSQNFPVRDPFFKMLNRSLATFMNAMTGPDYTLYPFSSTNEKDFRNLQKVYLDAVLKPNLRYIDFLQEGWRLENTDLNDIKSSIDFKGVVFNEMKGAFATNNAILNCAIQNNLLPESTYGHISGGWPLDIPKLSYDDLVEFHSKHYHPSNARFFSYGNFDVLPSLKYINETYLSTYEPQDSTFSQVAKHPRWTEPKETTVTCRFDSIGAPIEKQCQIAIGYVMNDITDTQETLLLNVLSELLVKGPNSAFYKTLIEPNEIGGAFNQCTGYDAYMKDTTFVVGLQNISSKDFDLVERKFNETIDQVIEEGFDKEHLQSILNSIELNIKHQTPKFGLHLLFGATAAWNHDTDLLDALDIERHFEQLKRNLEDDTFLRRKFKEYFKDNKHRLTVKMVPDEGYETNLKVAEEKLLAEKVAQLSDADKKEIFELTNTLAKEQKALPNNTHLLPCLSMDDVTKTVDDLNIQHILMNNVKTQLTMVDTNDLVYARGFAHAQHLAEDEILLLPLLTQIFSKMGTKSRSYRDFDKLVHSKTSGIGFSLDIRDCINDVNKYDIGVGFHSYCLQANTGDMFNLMKELILDVQLTDVDRFKVLLDDYVASLTADIAQTGQLYAIRGAASLIHETQQLKAKLFGIEHIEYMKNLCKTHEPAQILEQLQQVTSKLFEKSIIKCALNVSERSKLDVLKSFDTFTKDIGTCLHPEPYLVRQTVETKQLRRNENSVTGLHHAVNLPVNYCSKAILTVPYTTKHYPLLQVVSRILTSKYLLPVVREQNGAYGAGAVLDMSGTLNFYSYRDPGHRQTLDVFDQSLDWLRDNWAKIDEQAIFEAKLAILQGVDAPVAAGNKGLLEFQYGITRDIFAKNRERIIGADRKKLQKAFETYLQTKETEYGCSGKCVLGPAGDQLDNGTEKWHRNDFSASE